MNRHQNNKSEKRISEFSVYQKGRRSFLKNTFALVVLSQTGLLQSCVKEFIPEGDQLSKKQYNIIIIIQNILFPKDHLGPGAFDFEAHKYLLWVLGDQRLDPSDQQYIIDGIGWTDETANEEMAKDFLDLSEKEQKELVAHISRTDWGETWLSVQLTYIFEAMISDPVYGYNKSETGWKWLSHYAGYPRPTKELRYDEIFQTVQKNS